MGDTGCHSLLENADLIAIFGFIVIKRLCLFCKKYIAITNFVLIYIFDVFVWLWLSKKRALTDMGTEYDWLE